MTLVTVHPAAAVPSAVDVRSFLDATDAGDDLCHHLGRARSGLGQYGPFDWLPQAKAGKSPNGRQYFCEGPVYPYRVLLRPQNAWAEEPEID
jgi:hypothetical protein